MSEMLFSFVRLCRPGRFCGFAACLVFVAGAAFAPAPARAVDPADASRLVRLARRAVWDEVAGRSGEQPASAPDSDNRQNTLPAAPVFVTIERAGRVVGCRGSLASRGRSLNEAVVLAARAAAGHDPRYKPLTPTDLSAPSGFLVTVTIVSRLVPTSEAGIDSLAPGDGLVLRTNGRTGVVLPWEGRDGRTRLGWAYKKAGAVPGSACTLERMIAQRFRG